MRIFMQFPAPHKLVGTIEILPILALALLLANISKAQNAQILEIENSVQTAVSGESEWVKATQNQSLAIGDRIRTRQRSRAALALTGLYTVRLDQFTTIEITKGLVDSEKPRLDLLGGTAFIFSRELEGKMDIQMPGANAALRGTQLYARVLPGGKSIIQVLEGRVEMENAGGRLTLEPGQAGEASPGQKPRRTAVIEAKNILQWALYYPAVIDLSDLGLADALSKSLAAYRKGNLLDALEFLPATAPQDANGRLYHASVLLAVGRLDESRLLLSGVPKNHSGKRALDRMIAAVLLQPSGPWQIEEIKSASEAIAESYFLQSRAELEPARIAALRATELAPTNGFAWTRLAELEFSTGNTRAARTAIEKGLTFTPENARSHALRGFILSSENRIADAKAAFENSVQLDGGFGNGWLGLGLTKIKQGDLESGRADLQTAATVEPTSSIFHSYLAKAMSQDGRNAEAMKDLKLAQLLDPNDPTPWLYSALIHQEQYKPILAITELEKSIALNDNRRLYRSALLLDQDRAVRGANLAKLYQNAGMTDVAVREATRAVESDYTNASAHLFLANSYDVLRDPRRIELRQETPWFNELLLANLLGPVGAGPLSQFVSQGEYSKLMEADGSGASLNSEWRSNSEQRTTASVFGTYGRVSYGIDASYYDSSGDRPNSDNTRTEVYGQFKYQVTPDDVFYFLGKWQDAESGDNFNTYDNQPLSPGLRFSETQEPGLLLGGWNHRWGPGSNTLFLGGRLSANQNLTDPRADQFLLQRDPSALSPGFVRRVGNSLQYTDPALQAAIPKPVSFAPDGASLIYSQAVLEAISPYIGSGQVTGVFTTPFDFATQREFEIYTAELQHIQQNEWNTFIAGARWQGGEFETDTRLSIARPTFFGGFSTPAAEQHSETEMQRTSLYTYDYYRPFSWLTLIGGLTWDRLEHPDNFRSPPVNDEQRDEQELSAKLGFTLSQSPAFHLRGAYAEGLGGVTFDESVRLEPSQIAGFSQAYRTVISESLVGSVEAPLFKTWGLGMDGVLPSRTWWGAAFKVIEQDVDRSIGAFSGYDVSIFPNTPAYFPDDTSQRLAYRECALGATVNQLIGDEFSMGLAYQITRSELRTTLPELVGVPNVKFADLKDRATLQELTITGNWNSPSGWFASIEANAFSQNLDDDPRSSIPGITPRDGDSFCQFNALVGFRFHRNQGAITLGLLNIGDTDYQLSPLTPFGEISRSRTAVVTCRFNF